MFMMIYKLFFKKKINDMIQDVVWFFWTNTTRLHFYHILNHKMVFVKGLTMEKPYKYITQLRNVERSFKKAWQSVVLYCHNREADTQTKCQILDLKQILLRLVNWYGKVSCSQTQIPTSLLAVSWSLVLIYD